MYLQTLSYIYIYYWWLLEIFLRVWANKGDGVGVFLFPTPWVLKYSHAWIFIFTRIIWCFCLRLNSPLWIKYKPNHIFIQANKMTHTVFWVWNWQFNIFWLFFNSLRLPEVNFESLSVPGIDVNIKLNQRIIKYHNVL